ncbi:zinc-binding dehydrogenase [Kitasatospora sp. NPDC056783]|uniref:zinc-binding dehydrogenase n=1 Tax=Kitasatospora sp. NPDC056783 TaxID=3345943 RepID=UPI0036BBA454
MCRFPVHRSVYFLGRDLGVHHEALRNWIRQDEADRYNTRRIQERLGRLSPDDYEARYHAGQATAEGRLVTYGASSRQPASAIPPSRLAVDSITVAGFWLVPLLARDGADSVALAELLDLTARSRLRPLVGAEYDLPRARDAHEDLLGRRSKGKPVLRP